MHYTINTKLKNKFYGNFVSRGLIKRQPCLNVFKLGKMTISTIEGANKLCQSYIMMETVYIVITMSSG